MGRQRYVYLVYASRDGGHSLPFGEYTSIRKARAAAAEVLKEPFECELIVKILIAPR